MFADLEVKPEDYAGQGGQQPKARRQEGGVSEMAKVTAIGPVGVLLALSNIDAAFDGVSHRVFRSGKYVDGPNFRGEGQRSKFYINGNVCKRSEALKRISLSVKDGQKFEIEGRLRGF